MNYKIKVCGMRDPDNIRAVAELAPDFMGFIFYEKSPRYVGEELQIPPISKTINKVGVFVNHPKDFILKQIEKHNFGYVQLHGSESPELCLDLKSQGIKVIKAIAVDSNFDFNTTDQFENNVDYFLFDTKSAVYGGTGKTFDWSLLNNYKLSIPFFLSGGLNAENIKEIDSINHKSLFALDLNSGVEHSPGIKDTDKIKNVLAQLNQSAKV